MKTSNRRGPRGSTMMELLIAGAIMAVGLTGVTTMVLRSSAVTRDGASSMNAASQAVIVLDQYSATGACTLAAGTGLDGGIVYDGAGRGYASTVDITNLGDGGFPRVFRVAVNVAWNDAAQTRKMTNLTTMVSGQLLLDGGCF